MIKNPNLTSSLSNRSILTIKDSLLGDALERNQIDKPNRLIPASVDTNPDSQPSDGQHEPAAS